MHPTVRIGSVAVMTYVIGQACVDVLDKSRVQECPVDCIYEGAGAVYISPDECVDCGACKLICRVGAVGVDTPLVAAMPRCGS